MKPPWDTTQILVSIFCLMLSLAVGITLILLALRIWI